MMILSSVLQGEDTPLPPFSLTQTMGDKHSKVVTELSSKPESPVTGPVAWPVS